MAVQDALVTPPIRQSVEDTKSAQANGIAQPMTEKSWYLFWDRLGKMANRQNWMVNVGTHANRPPAANMPEGAIYVEFDRGAIYQNWTGAWQYLAGTMWGTLSPDQRPTDLGSHDAGFDFRTSVPPAREFIWSGSGWVEIGTDYRVNGTLIGNRPALNLIAGSNVTISGSDNAGSDRVDVTVSSTGGGTGGAVSSVFTRTGAVVAQAGDYTAAQVTNAVDQTGTYANPAWITSLAWSKITGAPATGVSSVFGRTGAVVATTGDYTAAQVTNAVDSTGSYANPAWITALGWSKITGAPAFLTSLTPWTSNINGNGFSLSAANNITITGSLGVGTASPAADLHILRASGYTQVQCENTAGTGDTGYVIKDANRNYKLGINVGASGAGTLCIFDLTAGFNRIFLTSSGNFGIGVNPTHQLHLSIDDAAKPSTNTWAIASGASVKQHVKDLQGGLEIINRLRPTEAEYNGQGNTPKGRRVVSLIAEEVQQILPHTVTKDSEGNLSFNVHEVLFHLILAVQQLSRKID